MDRRTDWPWDWQEEAEWKAELEERDYDFLAGLIDDAVEMGAATSPVVLGPRQGRESVDDAAPEDYLIAA